MNTPVLFLLGALALSALGAMIVWAASRPRKERFGSSVQSFSQNLDALAPPGQKRQRPQQLHRPANRATPQAQGRPGPQNELPQNLPQSRGPQPRGVNQPVARRPRPGPTPRRNG